jgi:two-component system response regulator RegX3
MAIRILTIQQEESPSDELLLLSEAEDYQVHSTALNRPEGLLFMVPPDLVILDLHHVGPETRRFCREICRQTRNLMLPLMLLTGSTDEIGLPSEPNACLVRPLPPGQIAAVINSLAQNSSPRLLAAGELRMDLDAHMLHTCAGSCHLSPKEFCLLETFLRHPSVVLSRSFLMREVWDTDYVLDTRTLDVHIHWIRRKIEPDARRPRYLRTVRGVGYYFVPSLTDR